MSLQQQQNKRLNHVGQLSMEFSKRRDKTVMSNLYQNPPLRASRALYMNAANPSEATVYMVETSGGLVAGDQNNFQIEVKEGADVCLIPQSATKIYPSFNGKWSEQNIDATIENGATLAWKTEAVIPFVDAKFRGKTVIHMAPEATLLWGEILSPGRDKRGEKFEYSHVRTNFQVWKEDECLIYDPLLFSPEDMNLKQVGMLEDHLYIGSLWFITPGLESFDIKELNEELKQFKDMKVGASLIEGKVINVRWLGSDLVVLKREMHKLWDKLNQFKTNK